MGDPLQTLTDADLRTLAAALAVGRLSAPYTAMVVSRFVSPDVAGAVAAQLADLADRGMSAAHAAVVVEAILKTRLARPALDDAVELVWTGPEVTGTANRDTGVVVRELFTHAVESVMVAGFAVYRGRAIFQALGRRMNADPRLKVRLYLDVHRGHQNTAADDEIVRWFARRFVEEDWPTGCSLPEVYYDPRSLAADSDKRSRLHAKCVVVDRRVAFVTSANFTEAAQERNIEVGALVRSSRLATRLVDHFGALVETTALRRLPLSPSSTQMR